MAMPQRDEKIEAIKRLDALLEYAVMHSDEAEAARDCAVHGGGAVLGVGLPPDGRTTDFPG